MRRFFTFSKNNHKQAGIFVIASLVTLLGISSVFSLTTSAMSRGVGERILKEYVEDCRDYNLTKHDKNKKQDVRCQKIRVDLKKGADCDFGALKASVNSLADCNKKVEKLVASTSGSVGGSTGSGSTSGSGGSAGSGSSAASADVGELGGLDIDSVKDAGVNANDSTLTSIVNIVFSLAGALALLFVVIGGLRFILSRGDPQSTAQARGTILYALVGLVVTISAYAIVRFAIGSL